jgi:F0F1-type ATP synthase assembly protein I
MEYATTLVANVLMMTLAGLWIEKHFHCAPWGMVFGPIVGLLEFLVFAYYKTQQELKRLDKEALETESALIKEPDSTPTAKEL